MCKIMSDYRSDIEKYCTDNGLSSKKVFSSPKAFNDEMVFVQFHDPSKGKMGLLDETPAPVVLKIFKTEDGLVFEQTEHTKQYLAQ